MCVQTTESRSKGREAATCLAQDDIWSRRQIRLKQRPITRRFQLQVVRVHYCHIDKRSLLAALFPLDHSGMEEIEDRARYILWPTKEHSPTIGRPGRYQLCMCLYMYM